MKIEKSEVNMKKYILLIGLLGLSGSAMAVGMVGGPIFCLGEHITSMTVEASKIEMDVPAPNGGSGSNETMSSSRLFLTGRYGLTSWLDVDGRVGTANLDIQNSPTGFSNYSANHSLAWGAGLKMGIPFDKSPYQFTLSANYTGYKANGNSQKGVKTVYTNYLWQEITPAMAFGYQVGKFVPYIGACKPLLFGKRDVRVVFNGQEFPTAGGSESYSDSKQDFRGVLGLEWKLPEGYSATAEIAGTQNGLWMFFVGFSQVIK
jgi:hypothetical protein